MNLKRYLENDLSLLGVLRCMLVEFIARPTGNISHIYSNEFTRDCEKYFFDNVIIAFKFKTSVLHFIESCTDTYCIEYSFTEINRFNKFLNISVIHENTGLVLYNFDKIANPGIPCVYAVSSIFQNKTPDKVTDFEIFSNMFGDNEDVINNLYTRELCDFIDKNLIKNGYDASKLQRMRQYRPKPEFPDILSQTLIRVPGTREIYDYYTLKNMLQKLDTDL